jgi:hypothetical protein
VNPPPSLPLRREMSQIIILYVNYISAGGILFFSRYLRFLAEFIPINVNNNQHDCEIQDARLKSWLNEYRPNTPPIILR